MQSTSSSIQNSMGSTASSSLNDSAPLWEYVVTKEKSGAAPGGNKPFICNFCKGSFNGSYSRVKAHLLKISGHGIRVCEKVTNEEAGRLRKLQEQAELKVKEKLPKQVPLPSASSNPLCSMGVREGKRQRMPTAIEKSYDVATRNEIKEEISRFFYTACPSFNLARNPHFINSYVKLSNSGIKGFKPPTYNELRTTLLDRERIHLDRLLEPIKGNWAQKGISIVTDGWTDVQKRPLINFIAITDSAPIFLKAINCQGEVKDKHFISNMMKEVIEEVGPQKVVQVVRDNAPVCKAAGMIIESLFPTIFWTPCVVHTLNLALKNICAARNTQVNQIVYDECSWINVVHSDVVVIKNFITNHSMRLHMYLECCDLKLLSAAETRFASVIIVFKRFFQVKRGLKEMVIKDCWSNYQEDNIDRANFVREKILDEAGFWKKVEYVLKFTEPIYEMLRIADTDKPCLHLIYEMWDSMIDKVKTIIYHHEGKKDDEESTFFNVVSKILNERWAKSNTPLRCLAHSLNPRYYSPQWVDDRPKRVPPHMDGEISHMRNQCFKRLFPNSEKRRIVIGEFVRFSICGAGFEHHDSIADRGELDPLAWWVTYGGVAPILQGVALKLLFQPSSSSCSERNWKTYSLIHDAKRNPMTPKRAEDLVFVHSNLRLLSRKSKEYSEGDSTFWDVAGDAHEPFDGAEQLAIANLSLDEPEFERIVFGDDV